MKIGPSPVKKERNPRARALDDFRAKRKQQRLHFPSFQISIDWQCENGFKSLSLLRVH